MKQSDTKGITPEKAKRRPDTWKPSPAKKGGTPMATKKMPYRKQGR